MEIIRFVLSGFWVWLGAVILILTIVEAVVQIVKAVHVPRTVEAYKIGERWHVKIEGARRGDVAEALNAAEAAEKEERGQSL